MRIGINAQILKDAATGVARYAENMITALISVPSQHSFVVFGSETSVVAAIPGSRIVATSPAIRTSTGRILWEQIILPGKARSEAVDLLYYPDHTAPLLNKPCKIVITVHDLSFFAMPETHGLGRRMYKTLTFRRSLAQADRIIADSDSTQTECRKYFKVPKEKIKVIHNGVDPRIRRETNAKVLVEVKKKYGLRDPFMLHVGTLERRKNIVRLIDAFSLVKKRGMGQYQLVLAGGRGHGYDEILRARERSGVSQEIALPGFVAGNHLSALYTLADMLVYPSLYEGFGFPPVEAMACGCPVIASNTTSLPEVVDGAGILIDPNDTADLAAAMLRLPSEARLRENLIARGYAQAGKFSWNEAARQLMNVFDSLS